MKRLPIPGLLLRLAAYLAIQGVVIALYAEAVMRAGVNALGGIEVPQLLDENAIVEWTQAGVLACIWILGLGAFRRGEPTIHRVLALLAVFAMFRELDALLKDLMFDRAHHGFMWVTFFAIMTTIWLGRHNFLSELPGFLTRPGFPFMFWGILLVVLYAQIMGQRGLWRFLAPNDVSAAKRFVEEGLELMGYVNVALGFVEERFFSGRAARRGQVSRVGDR
jgi:hypothetical protein